MVAGWKPAVRIAGILPALLKSIYALSFCSTRS